MKDPIFLHGKGNENLESGTAVKRIEFVSNRMVYIILIGC
jgi:hypothetical protein